MYKRLIRVYGDGFNFLASRDRLNKKLRKSKLKNLH